MAFAPQKVQIKRTATANNPPVGLAEGELSVEMGVPLRLWVGVPTSLDATGKKLLVPQSGVVVGDVPPSVPGFNQLWWESDSGILWLWYNDGGSTQWVQVSNSGAKTEEVVTDADEVRFEPGGGLSADDVQEALIELDQEKVAKAGDTMTGFLNLSGDPTAPMHAATKQYTDAADLVLQTAINNKIGEAPTDGQSYVRKNGAWVAVTGAQSIPITFPVAGKPGTGGRINVPIAIVSTIPASLGGSLAYASVATTADAVFTVNKVSGGSTTAIGTITMKASGTHVFAGAGGTLAIGDILQVVAPGTQDATLADVGITIMTQRG